MLPHFVSEAQLSKGERDGLSKDPLANGSVIRATRWSCMSWEGPWFICVSFWPFDKMLQTGFK